jgi:hypothetical protein
MIENWKELSLHALLQEYVLCCEDGGPYQIMMDIEEEIARRLVDVYQQGMKAGVLISSIPVNDDVTNSEYDQGYRHGFADGDKTDIPPGIAGPDFSDE